MRIVLSEVYNTYFHFAEPQGSIEHLLGNTAVAGCSYRSLF